MVIAWMFIEFMFVYCLAGRFVEWWLIGWLVDWVSVDYMSPGCWLVCHWLIRWLFDWLVGCVLLFQRLCIGCFCNDWLGISSFFSWLMNDGLGSSLVDWLVDGWLIGWFIDWLNGCPLVGCLWFVFWHFINWVIDCLIDWWRVTCSSFCCRLTV